MTFTSKKLQQKKGGMGFIKGATLFFLGMSCILFLARASFDITPSATNAIMYMAQIFLTQSGNNTSATGISLDGIGGEVRLLNTLRIGSNVFTSPACGNADVCGVSLISRDFYSNGGDASFLGGDFGIGYDIGNSSNGGNLYVSNNVGIGTTGPNYKLDVRGTGSFSAVCINGSCQNTWPAGASAGGSTNDIQFKDAVGNFSGTNSLVRSGKRLGIGTNNPGATLHVDGNGKFANSVQVGAPESSRCSTTGDAGKIVYKVVCEDTCSGRKRAHFYGCVQSTLGGTMTISSIYSGSAWIDTGDTSCYDPISC